VGSRVDVLVEDQLLSSVAPKEPALNHSQATLTEALAVFDLLARIKPSLRIAEGEEILRAASDNDAGMLEGVLNPLLELFGKMPIATSNATRDQLYQAIVDLYAHVPRPGQVSALTLESLAAKSASELHRLGEGDAAFRFALKAMHPLAVKGADYSSFDRDGALSIFDPATGGGALTGEWIRDRSEMLYWHLVRNRDDVLDVVPNPAGQAYQFIERRVVDDAVVEERIRVGVSISQTRRVAFGSDRPDQWNGLGDADSLYGGGGDDRLLGLAGDDYLQGDAGGDFLHGGAGADTLVGGKDTDVLIGGAGADLYRWRRGDGSDYLIDFAGDGFGGDGAGTIEFLGTLLVGSLTLADQGASERIYSGPDGLTYTLTGSHLGRGILSVSKPDEPGGLAVLGFRPGDLGLTLEAPPPIEKSTLDGTLGADTLSSTGERQTVFGYEGNDRLALVHAHTEGRGGPGHDYLTDGISGETLYGEGGRDILLAFAGADWLDGGADAAALHGGGDAQINVTGTSTVQKDEA
jgi:hypothetical protein